MKIKLSKLEEYLFAYLAQCDKEKYLDILFSCGIILPETKVEEIDWEN